jgi:hypothetical protein
VTATRWHLPKNIFSALSDPSEKTHAQAVGLLVLIAFWSRGHGLTRVLLFLVRDDLLDHLVHGGGDGGCAVLASGRGAA